MEEDDVVLGTVEKIEGTTVFVKLPTGERGTIISSEIASGRIKNIRQYVVPNKKIVCKVLRVSKNHIDLSLRRVSAKEKKEVMDKYKQEQTAKSAFHSILKDKASEVENKILEKFSSLYEFLIKAKEDKTLISNYIPPEFQEQIKKLTEKKQKQVEVKKNIKIRCLRSDGINVIKKIFSNIDKKAKVTYISAGNFLLTIKDENYKTANKKLEEVIKKIEQLAKNNSCEMEVIEKK